jgi:hypothetical protein
VTDQLARRLDVSALVAIYEQAERDIRAGCALIAQAEQALNDAFTMEATRGVRFRDRWDRVNFSEPESSIAEVRRDIWRSLIERLELRRFMSIAAWKELSDQVEKGDPPEVTTESVNAMAKQFHDALPNMLEQAVEEVFNWLRPPRSEYKTNSEFEIGERVILNWLLEPWGQLCSSWRVNYRFDPELTALENVFSALDGKGQITKGHYSQISTAIRQMPNTADRCEGETEYFAFRGFKKGTLHIRFKRLDLLARLNQIAGGKRLRRAG